MSIRAFTMLLSALLFPALLAAQPHPFEICAQSTTWVRPSLQMQQTKIWNDPRYKDFGQDAYAWTHDFLVLDEFMDVSGILAVTNLSGLWTVKTQWLHKCYLDQEHSISSWIQVVALLHRVKEVQHDANTYTVVVEPSGKGFQWIFIRRLNGWGVLRFVTSQGKQLDVWDERAVPAWLTKALHPTIHK